MSKDKDIMWAITEPGGYILYNCVRKLKKKAIQSLTENSKPWAVYQAMGYDAIRVTVEKLNVPQQTDKD